MNSTEAARPDALHRDALAVLQPGFTGTTAPDWLRRRLGEGLVSVGLFGRNITDDRQLAALTAQLRAERPELLVAVDEEGGDVTRLDVREGSAFPGNLALGAVDDTALTREVAHALGARLAACGVNLNWAPCADVNSDPRNPVIGVRSFGSGTELAARHTAAYVEGLQSAGVAACTKHFPGHGDTSVDSHLALPRVDADEALLHARELVPFRAAIEAGTRAVMSAHLLVPALDPENPATLSPRILTGLLREELGYRGLVVTDGIEMGAIADTYGIERGAVLALAAGADAVCVGGGLADEATVLRLRDALTAAVREGTLPEERLAEAAGRVRELAAWTAAHAAGGPGAAGTPGGAEEPAAAEAYTRTGLRAARRALRATPDKPVTPLSGPPYVASLTVAVNFAVGEETPWGPAAELRALLPGTRSGSYGAAQGEPAALAGEILAAAGERPLVVVVRDAHRHGWMTEVLDRLLAVRPEAVVVEMGVPQSPPRGALHLATHGAARVCARAAAEVLAGVRD
ncbi:glycoside hydrolase family 3 protein [Streptomyces physcomitrii]|uniref:Glycoside hydrolase family 3 protein n=1 Tax=Streptomyces physcomitrii TaxID=2724184 RepID=A0ABX1GWF5_9ACTN|nr:glycoside hydrolase family 3 protein [Streptomyces physcomitrii]NKI40103.1 glycoside hydrolase family 3 protein [Streptomyces physcomitrii]